MKHPSKFYEQIVWRFGLDIFSRGTGFVLNILVARHLGVLDFGKFGYAVSLTQIFYIFTDFGTTLQLIKELGESRGRSTVVWAEYLKLKLAMMAACAVVMAASMVFLWKWEHPWLLMLMMFWMFSNAMLDFNQAVCNGLGRMDLARTQLIIQRSFFLIGAVVPIFIGKSLEAMVVGISIGGVTGTLISNAYFLRESGVAMDWKPKFSEWRAILVRAFPNSISTTFGAWYLRIGFVLLAWISTEKELGQYTSAFRIFEIAYMVSAGVMGVGFPHLSESSAYGPKAFATEVKRVTFIMLALAAGWMLMVIPGSSVILSVLFGKSYSGAVPVLRVFGFAGGIVAMNFVAAHLMIVLNSQARHALHEGLTFFIALALSLTLIPTHNGVGAAMAIVGAECGLFVMTVVYIARKWPTKFDQINCGNIPPL